MITARPIWGPYVIKRSKRRRLPLSRRIARERDLLEALATYYADGTSEPGERVGEIERTRLNISKMTRKMSNISETGQRSPVIRLVNVLIARALERRGPIFT